MYESVSLIVHALPAMSSHDKNPFAHSRRYLRCGKVGPDGKLTERFPKMMRWHFDGRCIREASQARFCSIDLTGYITGRVPKPGKEYRLDICQANSIDPVKSSVLREYAAQVVIAERVPVDELLALVRDRQLPVDECFKRVLREAQQVQDEKGDDVALHKYVLSLNCPLSQMRIADPCRGANCEHIQCYDARFYLTVNSRRETWDCPVCNKPAPLESLRIDAWMARVLGEADPSVVDIELQPDGSWVPVADDDSDDDEADAREAASRKRPRVSTGGDGSRSSAPEQVLHSPPPQQTLLHRLPWNNSNATSASSSAGAAAAHAPGSAHQPSQQLHQPPGRADGARAIGILGADEHDMQR